MLWFLKFVFNKSRLEKISSKRTFVDGKFHQRTLACKTQVALLVYSCRRHRCLFEKFAYLEIWKKISLIKIIQNQALFQPWIEMKHEQLHKFNTVQVRRTRPIKFIFTQKVDNHLIVDFLESVNDRRANSRFFFLFQFFNFCFFFNVFPWPAGRVDERYHWNV